MSARPLLIELFTEELPPKALKRLGEAFAGAILEGLQTRGLAPTQAASRTFCSPRRLAVRVDEVVHRAPDRVVDLKGPSIKVGLDAQGEPTQALVKWAQKQGATVEQLTRGRKTVTVLHEGSVLAEGLLSDVQANDKVVEVYLGR